MLIIFKELTNNFEQSLLDSLKKNDKEREFEILRKNLITQSSKEEFGDYQCNVCLSLSKIYKKNPRDISTDLINLLNKNKSITKLCKSLEIAGPGFINIKLKDEVLISEIKSNIQCQRAGVPQIKKDLDSGLSNKVIVDFSSPNIAKEMHVGHLRSTIIGDSISRIFELRGYQVLRLNHVGDWGTQFGMLITQLKDLYSNDLEEIGKIKISDLVEFYKESKKRFDNEYEFQKRSREEVVKLQSGNIKSIKAWKLLCDQSRKKVLIDHGFRLPSAADNRPLKCEEFWEKSKQTLFISATPGQWELDQCDGEFIEQVIRPTGVLDPVIDVRPSEGQIEDLLSEIRIRAEKNQRVLVTTLTKRMAEDLTDFLSENKVRVRYLHSEIHSIERIEIIQDLRMGEYDVLVGVNLLREGLDLPEVSLVAILDADKEGFLRAERSLIQTIGRAARHVEGVALLYADNFTDSMKRAISETERRRTIQKKYNQVNGITPKPAGKKIENSILSFLELSRKLDAGGLSKDLINIVNNKTEAILNSSDKQCLLEELPDLIEKLEIKMKDAAKELNFEEAANLRDRIKKLRQKLARNN